MAKMRPGHDLSHVAIAPLQPTFKDAKFSGENEEDGTASDLILRSSDMLPSDSSQANELRDGKPVVPLPETSAALEKLHLLAYPRVCGELEFNDLGGIGAAYEAAEKYLVRGASGHSGCWRRRRVFSIACHRGLEDICKTAAMVILICPVVPPTATIPEYTLISAHQILKLHEFTRSYMASAEKLALDHCHVADYDDVYRPLPDYPARPGYMHIAYGRVWWRSHGHISGYDVQLHNLRHRLARSLPTPWFCQHMKQVAQRLKVFPLGRPAYQAVMDVRGPFQDIVKCKACSENAVVDLTEIAAEFSEAVDRENAKLLAELTLTWSPLARARCTT
ncbi:hypothetical protein B0H10DRAFT_2217473 [Mycena sp. CBHHK59/15]|nr:hypothetical protein B0H10DRAFT_2217473 [Mycena sp. CBHHK59/15]